MVLLPALRQAGSARHRRPLELQDFSCFAIQEPDPATSARAALLTAQVLARQVAVRTAINALRMNGAMQDHAFRSLVRIGIQSAATRGLVTDAERLGPRLHYLLFAVGLQDR